MTPTDDDQWFPAPLAMHYQSPDEQERNIRFMKALRSRWSEPPRRTTICEAVVDAYDPVLRMWQEL